MLYYVTHKYDGTKECYERTKAIVQDFQEDDWENCYVSPILCFPFTAGYDPKIALEIRLDLLTVCDCLLVASQPDEAVNAEIALAKTVGMEIWYV